MNNGIQQYISSAKNSVGRASVSDSAMTSTWFFGRCEAGCEGIERTSFDHSM